MTRTSSWALALAAGLLAGLADAQTPIGRSRHAAILLRDGTVLIAGGSDGNGHTLVVERFVPWSGWDAGQSLAVVGGMGEPAAALLPNGRVLFVDTGARLFDPDRDAWQELGLGFPQSRRSEHTLTVLHDGRVLLAGGIDYSSAVDAGYPLVGEPTADAGWIWKEVEAGEIGFALRRGHTAVLRPDGTVLLIGGVLPLDGTTPGVPVMGLFDPNTDSIRDAGIALTSTRTMTTATRRLNRDIFVFGDYVDSNAPPLLLGDAGVAANALSRSGPSMSIGHHAVLYPTGDIEVLGGFNSGNPQDSTWWYPASGGAGVINSDPLLTARGDHSATLLMNGKLLIVGGQAAGDALTYEVRDPIGFGLKPLNDSFGLPSATVTPLPSGSFLVVGGEASVDGQAVLKIGPTGGSSAVTLPIPGRVAHTATLLTSDEVLILGGRSQSGGGILDDCWLVNVNNPSGAAKRCPPMLGKRENHTATLLKDGKVLVAGGNDENGSVKKTTMIFDPRANGGTWQWSTDMNQPRDRHAAVMEPSGRVLLIGGGVAAGSTDWFERDAGMTVGPSLVLARRAHTATLLRDGRILVAGGTGSGGLLNRVEVYDPITGSWAAQGTTAPQVMGEGRAFHSAVAMPTGDVVLAGGGATGGTKADRWSPLKGTFETTGLSTPRRSPAVVLGSRGEVLVVGGGSDAGEKVLAFRHFLEPGSGGLDHTLTASGIELQNGKPFVLRLSGAWRAASEASSGNTRNSSVSLPRLLLQRLDNGEVVVPLYDFDPVAGEFTVYGTSLSEGHWRAWAYASGVPGNAAWFRVGDAGTLAWDAGLPDAGSDGGATDAGTGSDGGIPSDGYSASVTLDSADPHYTLVKVETTVRVASKQNVSGISVTVTGSADLAVCIDTDCQVGNVLTFDIPGEVGAGGVPLPPFDVRPLKDSDAHTVTATVIQGSVGKVAVARATFESVTADESDLAPGVCGCTQTPFGAAAVWALVWLLRKVRPKARQRL